MHGSLLPGVCDRGSKRSHIVNVQPVVDAHSDGLYL